MILNSKARSVPGLHVCNCINSCQIANRCFTMIAWSWRHSCPVTLNSIVIHTANSEVRICQNETHCLHRLSPHYRQLQTRDMGPLYKCTKRLSLWRAFTASHTCTQLQSWYIPNMYSLQLTFDPNCAAWQVPHKGPAAQAWEYSEHTQTWQISWVPASNQGPKVQHPNTRALGRPKSYTCACKWVHLQ